MCIYKKKQLHGYMCLWLTIKLTHVHSWAYVKYSSVYIISKVLVLLIAFVDSIKHWGTVRNMGMTDDMFSSISLVFVFGVSIPPESTVYLILSGSINEVPIAYWCRYNQLATSPCLSVIVTIGVGSCGQKMNEKH